MTKYNKIAPYHKTFAMCDYDCIAEIYIGQVYTDTSSRQNAMKMFIDGILVVITWQPFYCK